MDEEVSRDVVRIRFLLEGGRGIDLQAHGTEAGLPNNFYAERLRDMRDVRAIVAYARDGTQVWHQDRGPKRDAWWPTSDARPPPLRRWPAPLTRRNVAWLRAPSCIS
jgi:hypothetical protein